MRCTSSILGQPLEAIDRRRFEPRRTSRRRCVRQMLPELGSSGGSDQGPVRSASTSMRGLRPTGMPTASTTTIWPAGRCRTRRCRMPTSGAPWPSFTRHSAWWRANSTGRSGRDGAQMLRLIDSTPIPLGNSAIGPNRTGASGMNTHVVYDPRADCPRLLDITDANVNDAQIGRRIAIEAGATYVFDKRYCHYGWWRHSPTPVRSW